MKIIGITGGVGCGKSRVLHYLEEEYGAVICEADQVAKELQRPGKVCFERMREAFGEQILLENGEIDRKKLGGLVFGCPQKLARLNQIVHPAVKEEIVRRAAEEKKKRTELFVVEAALLLEDGYDQICDEIWYIYADEGVREERLMKSRGYTREHFRRMVSSQRTEKSFRVLCQRIIDNSGKFEDTCRQLKNAVESIY